MDAAATLDGGSRDVLPDLLALPVLPAEDNGECGEEIGLLFMAGTCIGSWLGPQCDHKKSREPYKYAVED
jgi:hypothetical protein